MVCGGGDIEKEAEESEEKDAIAGMEMDANTVMTTINEVNMMALIERQKKLITSPSWL